VICSTLLTAKVQSHQTGNNGAETALAGWGARIRTSASRAVAHMLTATTTADSQAHYALAPDLVAAPRQNNRHLPRPKTASSDTARRSDASVQDRRRSPTSSAAARRDAPDATASIRAPASHQNKTSASPRPPKENQCPTDSPSFAGLWENCKDPTTNEWGYVPLRFYDQAPNEVVASLHKCSGLLGAFTQALLHVQELTRRRSSSR
jgi:hypothetical protein